MATMSSSILLQLVAWVSASLDKDNTPWLSLEEDDRFLERTNGDGSMPSTPLIWGNDTWIYMYHIAGNFNEAFNWQFSEYFEGC